METGRKKLLIMLEEVKKGNFTIEDGVEDVHSQVEFNLTQKIGDAGKRFIVPDPVTIRFLLILNYI